MKMLQSKKNYKNWNILLWKKSIALYMIQNSIIVELY